MDASAGTVTIQGFRTNGDCSILLDFKASESTHESADLLPHIHAFADALKQSPLPDQQNVVPATTTLMLTFSVPIQALSELESHLQQLNVSLKPNTQTSTTHIIPVCYQPEVAPDLDTVLQASKLTLDELIQIHSSREYLVTMLGFLPGFMYLDKLDPRLVLPRKSTPSILLPAGSIAIAGNQCGVYSISSPGGWHVIGRTPLRLVNWANKEPIKIRAMDKLCFKSISLEAFRACENEIDA